MRRAAVLVLLSALLLSVVACDGPRTTPSTGTRAGGGERLARARREMGLDEVSGEESEVLPFELGPERLPELPEHVTPESDHLRAGLVRASETLAVARPAPDAELDGVAFQRWVEADYATWLHDRAEALRLAREALGTAEHGELGEYVVASAVIGVLFARLAAAVASIPLPTAIESDAGARLRFRDAFLRTASPLWDRAADAFGGCASATVRSGDSSLDRWQRFCDGELERAQEAPRPID